MPRFYFDLHDGRAVKDEDGTELPGAAEARIQAVRYVSRLLNDDPQEFWDSGQWTMEVKDEERRSLFVLEFSARSLP